VSKRDLPSAIALSRLGINVARALGPAIAGVLVSLSGPWAVSADAILTQASDFD
jgi:hypothetical protein